MQTDSSRMIKNFDQLAISKLRRQALMIAETGYLSIQTGRCFSRSVSYDRKKDMLWVLGQKNSLAPFRRVFLLAFGKAALGSAAALEELLQDRIQAGWVIDVKTGQLPAKYCQICGTHPRPSEINFRAAERVLDGLSGLTEQDLVLCAVSGGGSSLLSWPYEMDSGQTAELFDALTGQGASIFELNAVRKHLDRVKGGNLARRLYPAAVLGLIMSDVPGNDLSVIASGPTVKDSSTCREAQGVLAKYGVMDKLGWPRLKLYETPKEDKYFARVRNYLILSSRTVLLSMKDRAEELGFDVKIYSEDYQGQAKDLGRLVTGGFRKKNLCLLGAGESTVVISGRGRGGRNQEMALAALPGIGDNQVFICLASDGRDNSEAAGAVADKLTLSKAAALHLDISRFQEENDSFTFFEATGDLVQTGQTGTNVSDFFVLLQQ